MTQCIDIKRVRGDTVPEVFKLRLHDISNSIIDITTLVSITLTVNSVKDPPNDTTQLLQIVGAILDANKLTVEFVGAFDGLPVGTLYYDIEIVLPDGSIYTPVKGELEVNQDVTKP